MNELGYVIVTNQSKGPHVAGFFSKQFWRTGYHTATFSDRIVAYKVCKLAVPQ